MFVLVLCSEKRGCESFMRDMLVIGGGINGVGIARDAAGRGLDVLLCEKDDLASHTSSASSKLIHGGLRYLENYDFRLVRESLGEREILLRAAPHIIWPMRIVLPVLAGMRPSWMLRTGLFMYDHLARRAILPASTAVDLRSAIQGHPLKDTLVKGFEYSDCWADDSRLVAINAVDAAERGATILTRFECVAMVRKSDHWVVSLRDEYGGFKTVLSRVVVNAAGPWVEKIQGRFGQLNNRKGIRLVKGSHIVVNCLYDGGHGYLFQAADGRVIFVMPYEDDYTLIGTTEIDWELDGGPVAISDEETRYLCSAVNDYFKQQIVPDDVVWSYAGVRPLYDDKADSANVATRDYVFNLDGDGEKLAPVLSVYGGKLTTYRKLAEHAMDKLKPFYPGLKPAWTGDAALPGGDFTIGGVDALRGEVKTCYPWLADKQIARMVQAYGTRIFTILGTAKSADDLGHHFGAGLHEAEVRYLRDIEFARTSDDILWRRSKLGLKMSEQQLQAMEGDLLQKDAA
jgi:glycerol-3-phosphate dehydrogenase